MNGFEVATMENNTDRHHARVSALVEGWVDAVPAPGTYRSPSLSNGAATFAIFLCEAATYLGRPKLSEQAMDHIAYGIELTNLAQPSISLYQSIPGLAWAMSHVAGRSASVKAFQCDVEALLTEAVLTAPDSMTFDLINGAAGIMAFALRSAEHTSNISLIDALSAWYVRRFSYWLEHPEAVFPASSADSNLGLAHGIPGLLSVFAEAAQRNRVSQDAVQLTRAGLLYQDRFIVETRDGLAYVPNNQAMVEPARLAWCYGNLGVIFAYLRGGALAPELRDRPEQMLRFAFQQFGTPEARLNDATLCHGFAGSALQFHLLANDRRLTSTSREMARELAQRSIDATFENAVESRGLITFPIRRDGVTQSGMSLLEGSLGVCLALMATRDAFRPAWLELLAI